MADPITSTPLVQGMPILKGLLAGSLFVAGLAFPFGFGLQALLFFAGVLVFIDAIVPDGQVSIIATVLSAVFGGFLSSLAAVLGLAFPWTVLVTAATILFYFERFHRKKGRKGA